MNPTNPLRTFTSTALCLGVALCLSATGTMADAFSVIDDDGDGYVSDDQYYKYIEGIGAYDRWDRDRDGRIGVDERIEDFEYEHIGWDLDGDGTVDDTEFYNGTFNYYDADDDRQWDESEWRRAGEAGLFDQ